MRRGFILIMCGLYLLIGKQATAQNVPEAIHAALDDLSTRAGRVITLSDLSGWHWSEANYPDASLGCPQPGETYAETGTRGYQFQLNYQGIIYDYRVSANRKIVILCSPADSDLVTPTPTIIPPTPTAIPLPTVTATPAGEIVCAEAQPSYLRIGVQVQAQVTPIPVRSRPSQSSPILNQIPPGGAAWIIAGPECDDRLVWWAVDHNGVTGWTAEGQNGVEPPVGTLQATLTPHLYDLPAARPIITPTHLLSGGLSRIRALTIPDRLNALAWSPDGSTLAGAGESGVWLYDTADFSLAPRLLQVSPTYAVAFSRDILATGHEDTTIRLWDFAVGGQRTVLRGHEAPVSAITFSPDGTLLASAAGNTILLWDISGALVAVLDGTNDTITDLAFSPDGTLLASAGNTVRLWDMISATLAKELPHPAPAHAVAFSPDGTKLATAAEDGLVRTWEIGASNAVVLAGQSGPLVALTFSPDGRVLAAADSRMVFWDHTTGAELPAYGEQNRTAADLIFSPDGTVIALLILAEDPSSTIELWGVAE